MKTYRDLKQLLDGYKKKKPWYRYIIGDHPEVKRLQAMLKNASAESGGLDRPLSVGHAMFLLEYFKDNYQNYKRLKLGSARRKASKQESRRLKDSFKIMLLTLKEQAPVKKPLTTEDVTASEEQSSPAIEEIKKSTKQSVTTKKEISEENRASEETKKLEKQLEGFSPKEQRLLRSAHQKLINTQTNVPGLWAIVLLSDQPDKFADRLVHLKTLMKDATKLAETEKQDVWMMVLNCDEPEVLVNKLITLVNENGLTSTQVNNFKTCESDELIFKCDEIHLENLLNNCTKLADVEKQAVWNLVHHSDEPELLVSKLIDLANVKGLTSTQVKNLKACESDELVAKCDELIEAFADINLNKSNVAAEFAKRAEDARKRQIAPPPQKAKSARKQSSRLFESQASSSWESTTEDDSSKLDSSSKSKKR